MDIEKRRKLNRIIIIFSFIAVFSGIVLFLYDYIVDKTNNAFETINLEEYGNNVASEVHDDGSDGSDGPSGSGGHGTTVKYDYIGILEVPKINLKKGFVDMDSKHNNVDYNMQIIKPSSYPNVDKGNLIIASHSGNSKISYFKHLYKLVVNDKAIVYYNDIKYTYNIVKIYEQEKYKPIKIYRDIDKTTLTLITCTRNSDTAQTVYIAELENTEAIQVDLDNA